MPLTYKILKYIFLPYFITIFLAAILGRDLTNKYFEANLKDEYLYIVIFLILIDIVIYVFKKRTTI